MSALERAPPRGLIFQRLENFHKIAEHAGLNGDIVFIAEARPIINGIINVGSKPGNYQNAVSWVKSRRGGAAAIRRGERREEVRADYDQHLTCADCNHDFLWSAREQEFYREKGTQPPKRCKDCARARREERGGRAEGMGGNR